MRPNKLFLFTLLFSLLVFACSLPGALATPAGLQPPAATPPPLPGATPAPTLPAATLTSPTSAAPLPAGLTTGGPYLAYQVQAGDRAFFKFMDADGRGQASFSYPSNASPENTQNVLSNSLSPDGRWLAWYSGSAGTCMGSVAPTSADLALNLLDLTDGSTRLVTRLLSGDYPNIFSKAAQQLGQADVTAGMMQNAFVCGITQSLDWSPNGRYLAFAGQMDGLSSDLYVYDFISGAITRLSSGPQEVGWVSWSPDGKWILDGSTYSSGEGMRYDIFATSVDGKIVKQLNQSTPASITSNDWLNAHTYFVSDDENGPGSFNLQLVDVNTGRISTLWPGSYGPYAFAPEGKWVALFANTPSWPYYGSDFQTGIFLVNTTTLKQTRVSFAGIAGCCLGTDILALGHIQGHAFLTRDDSSQAVQYLALDASLTPANVQAAKISVSPDRLKWIAFGATIQVFSDDGSLLRTVDLPAGLDPKNIFWIVWRPDSSGLFFTYDDPISANVPSRLFAFDLSQGAPVQVDQFSPTNSGSFFWVGGGR